MVTNLVCEGQLLNHLLITGSTVTRKEKSILADVSERVKCGVRCIILWYTSVRWIVVWCMVQCYVTTATCTYGKLPIIITINTTSALLWRRDCATLRLYDISRKRAYSFYTSANNERLVLRILSLIVLTPLASFTSWKNIVIVWRGRYKIYVTVILTFISK